MTWIGTGIATIGALLCLLAAVGLFRLPDALSRLQAVTKASTMGLAITMTGAVVLIASVDAGVKALITVTFLWLVTPVSGHLIGRATYRTGLTGDLAVDELHEVTDHQTDVRDVGPTAGEIDDV